MEVKLGNVTPGGERTRLNEDLAEASGGSEDRMLSMFYLKC